MFGTHAHSMLYGEFKGCKTKFSIDTGVIRDNVKLD